MQIGSYVDININSLVPLDALDVDPEVKQLFIDVFHSDPQLRPGALELLNRPIISSAAEYGRYFDECYDSEDAEDLEASPALECGSDIPIADVPQHISLTSFGSQISLGDELGELPLITSDQKHIHSHSQDSRVHALSSQMIVRSSGRLTDSSKVLDQDSGLEDKIGDQHSQLGKHNTNWTIRKGVGVERVR